MKEISMILENIKELVTVSAPKGYKTREEMNDAGILNNVSVAIDNDTIIDIDEPAKIRKDYTAKWDIDCTGRVVLPGFVDPHTHPVYGKTRENEFEMRALGKTYMEIAESGGGIRSSVADLRKRSDQELYELAKKRIKKLLKYGTTTMEAKSGYGLTLNDEIRTLEIIKKLNEDKELAVEMIPTFLGAHDIPTEYRQNRQEYMRIIKEEMLPYVKEHKLAKFCDIFCEKGVYGIEESRDILKTAQDMGFGIRMHADELHPIGGAELAGEIGAITADHLVAASDEGIKAMAENSVVPVLLPGTTFSLGLKSYAPARKMIDAGLPVALSTDYNPGSCNTESMQMIISIAVVNMHLTTAEAICASTINAAYSLRLHEKVGSIEKGKQADLLIMDIPSYRFISYNFGVNNVEVVIKKGAVV